MEFLLFILSSFFFFYSFSFFLNVVKCNRNYCLGFQKPAPPIPDMICNYCLENPVPLSHNIKNTHICMRNVVERLARAARQGDKHISSFRRALLQRH